MEKLRPAANERAILVGDLNVAISGIAWAGGHTNAPPAAGKERMTWIGRNAEARELDGELITAVVWASVVATN